MKNVLKIVLLLSVLLIVLGYSFENLFNINGKVYIGTGVLIFAFVVMPLFIYQRYNGRIGDFIDSRMEKEPHQNDD